MLKQTIVVLACALGLMISATTAGALTIPHEHEIGVHYWAASPGGDLKYKDGDMLDLDRHLGFDREGSPYVYVRSHLDHLFLEAHYTRLDYSGESQTFPDTIFGDIDLDPGAEGGYITSDTDLDMMHGGMMLSFPVPDFDLGLGVGVTYFDAETDVVAGEQNGTQSDSLSTSDYLPVSKALVRIPAPYWGLSLSLAGEGIAYSGNSLYDIRAKTGFKVPDMLMGDITLKAGYRWIGVDYEEDELVLDSRFSGPFAGLKLTF